MGGGGCYTLILGTTYHLGLEEKNDLQCKKQQQQKKVFASQATCFKYSCSSLKSSTDNTEQTDLRFQVQVGKESG